MISHTSQKSNRFVLCMIGWFLLLAAALGILTERFLGISVRFQFPPCLFHLATGYYCPGCGGTRAVSALLHGQLLRSFAFHPVVPYGAALFLRALFGTSLELLTKGRLAWGYELKKKEIFCVLFLTTAHFLLINGCKWFLGLDLFKEI